MLIGCGSLTVAPSMGVMNRLGSLLLIYIYLSVIFITFLYVFVKKIGECNVNFFYILKCRIRGLPGGATSSVNSDWLSAIPPLPPFRQFCGC